MGNYLGLAGLPGLDPNPIKHFALNARRFPRIELKTSDVGHDAAAVVVQDGRVVMAVEEERLNRCKHFMGWPRAATAACLEAAGLGPDEVEAAYYLNLDEAGLGRRLDACAAFLGDGAPEVVREDYRQVSEVAAAYGRTWKRFRPVDHHLAHAASAFYGSAFGRSLILVMDAAGEAASTSVMLGDEQGIRPLLQLPMTGSLGYLYSNLTAYLGFEPIEDEYKIMGLAAYGGQDDYRAFFDEQIQPREDGSFFVPSILQPALQRVHAWSGALGAPRAGGTPIGDRHIAIAYSLQKAVERTVLRLLEAYAQRTGARSLCIAGGVGLNCAMNGVIDRSGLFDRLFVQPAAGDPGAALGAALLSHHLDHPGAEHRRMTDVYLGPAFTGAQVEQALQGFGGQVEWTLPEDYVGAVAGRLAAGAVVGWFQGRMEFGPRALGNRSILADPRDPGMKDRVNQMVKKREEFRPFAPSVTAEGAEDFFLLRDRSQYEYMTVAVKARPERAAELPAVVHVDGTARVHLVRKEVNPRYWELLHRFGTLTGIPVVLNTSFNIRGEPIVCTPEEAIRCFLGTGIDHLAIEGRLVSKKA